MQRLNEAELVAVLEALVTGSTSYLAILRHPKVREYYRATKDITGISYSAFKHRLGMLKSIMPEVYQALIKLPYVDVIKKLLSNIDLTVYASGVALINLLGTTVNIEINLEEIASNIGTTNLLSPVAWSILLKDYTILEFPHIANLLNKILLTMIKRKIKGGEVLPFKNKEDEVTFLQLISRLEQLMNKYGVLIVKELAKDKPIYLPLPDEQLDTFMIYELSTDTLYIPANLLHSISKNRAIASMITDLTKREIFLSKTLKVSNLKITKNITFHALKVSRVKMIYKAITKEQNPLTDVIFQSAENLRARIKKAQEQKQVAKAREKEKEKEEATS